MTVPGIWLVVEFETGQDRDHLAARIGNHAGRVAQALSRLPPGAETLVGRDLIGMLAVDRAFLCGEFLDEQGGPIVAYPAAIGCKGQETAHSLVMPVAADGTTSLRLRYTDRELV